MALVLALGLYHGGNMGSGEPPTPTAPVFASEPGALTEITVQNEIVEVGFVRATGYPSPTYILSSAVALPDEVRVFIGGSDLSLPAAVPAGDVDDISVQTLEAYTGSVTLTLTATNGVSPDAEAEAVIPIDVAPPAPVWAPTTLAVELPVIAPTAIGGSLVVDGATTIEVTALPDKGIYYIDDGDDTPLAVNDTFPAADLSLLTGESDSDTGTVTGALSLEAQGAGGNTTINITITIAEAAAPVIADRDFEIEEGTEAAINFDLTDMPSGGTATIENTTTGGAAVIIKYEDLSA